MTEANDSPREDHGEGTKTHEPARKREKNTEQLLPPPSLCSSLEGVPCDFSDSSLWLTERDRCSAPPVPPPPPPPSPINAQTVPCPSCPSHRHSDARGGKGGWGATSRRDSQWALVSSRPLHLARWDFVSIHRHKRRQMTINGYNDVFKKNLKKYV